MRDLNDKQWWAIWSAIALVLLIWWSGVSDAAFARARGSPEYVRDVQEATRDYEKDGNVQTFSYLLKTHLDTAYADAYRVERTRRLLGTVVAVSAFIVWRLGRRR